MARQTVGADYETPKIDRYGRMVIPERYRKLLNLSAGDSVALVYDSGFEGLILTALDIKGRKRA